MPKGINYDLGVQKRIDEKTGIEVFMYKREPGVFYNIFGKVLPEEIAADAGFDVAALTKHKLAREKMVEAQAAIEAELGLGAAQRKVIKEEKGYSLIQLGSGLCTMEYEGQQISAVALPKAQAEKLFNRLANPAGDKPQHSVQEAASKSKK